MKRADLVSGALLAAFGLVMLIFVVPAQIEAAPDGYVSPRLVPNIALILIVGLSLLLVIKSLRPTKDGGTGLNGVFSRGEMVALIKIAAVFAISLTAFILGSALLAGILLILGTLVILGERRPAILFLMPASLMLAVWALFYKLLGSPIV